MHMYNNTDKTQDVQLIPGTEVNLKIFFKIPGKEDQGVEKVMLHNITSTRALRLGASVLALMALLHFW